MHTPAIQGTCGCWSGQEEDAETAGKGRVGGGGRSEQATPHPTGLPIRREWGFAFLCEYVCTSLCAYVWVFPSVGTFVGATGLRQASASQHHFSLATEGSASSDFCLPG